MQKQANQTKCSTATNIKQKHFNSSNQLNLDLIKAKDRHIKYTSNNNKYKEQLHSSKTSNCNYNHSKYFPSSIEAIQKNSEYDHNYLNDSNEKEISDFSKPEPMPQKPNPNSHLNLNSNIHESEINKKLRYTLKTLDLYQFRKNLIDNCITFNDILLLSKNDLIEMGIQLGPRNRILKFAEQYKSYAKDFDMEELKRFFKDNKNLVINSIGDEDTTADSMTTTIKKKIEIDILKASMDQLCKEMSESTSHMVVSGYEEKLLQNKQCSSVGSNDTNKQKYNHYQQQKHLNNLNKRHRENDNSNSNNNCSNNANARSIRCQNIDLPDISEIKANSNKEKEKEKGKDNEAKDKVNGNKTNNHHTRNTEINYINYNSKQIQMKYSSKESNVIDTNSLYHRRQKSNPNLFKAKPITTIKRNWTLPKPIFLWNNSSANQIATLRTSRSIKSTKNTPLLESNTNPNTRNLLHQGSYNQCFYKKEKMKQTYNDLFTEIEAYQQDYHMMKVKNDQRNSNINNMLMQQTEKRPVIPISNKQIKCYDENVNMNHNQGSNSVGIEKINEIALRKHLLKNSLNECRESINKKKQIIQRLEEENNNNDYDYGYDYNDNINNDDMQYLFNV